MAYRRADGKLPCLVGAEGFVGFFWVVLKKDAYYKGFVNKLVMGLIKLKML